MLKVFMSYASEDRDLVRPYYVRLRDAGFFPWMDSESIMPGGVWIREIEQAFLSSDVFILFMSPRSVTKRGFVQKEAREAIDRLKYSVEGDITVIPACLEPCDVPDYVAKEVQYVLLKDDGWDRVIESLRIAARQRNIAIKDGAKYGQFLVFEENFKEEWSGNPGYELSISYPRFSSENRSKVASELSAFFSERATRSLLGCRSVKFDQMPRSPGTWGDGMNNNLEEGYDIAFVNDDLLSVAGQTWEYIAGAAHGNSGFSCWTFLLGDEIIRLRLKDFFSAHEEALSLISSICIRELKREIWERTGDEATDNDVEWFLNGAGPAWGNFEAGFTVGQNEFVIRFPPYQVHCYALGSWAVEIPFYEVKHLLSKAKFAQNLLTRRESIDS